MIKNVSDSMCRKGLSLDPDKSFLKNTVIGIDNFVLTDCLGVIMIRHILLIRFTDSATVKQIVAVKNAFLDISNRIPGIRSVEWGENDSLEGKSAGFTHCVLMTFQDDVARQQYLPHPEHRVLKKIFRLILRDIIVFDYTWNISHEQ